MPPREPDREKNDDAPPQTDVELTRWDDFLIWVGMLPPASKVAAGLAIVAIVLLAILYLAGDDGESDADAYAACSEAVQPVNSALAELDSRLDVGLNQDEYGTKVGDAKVMLDNATAAGLPDGCEQVGDDLAASIETHTDAVQAWNACITDSYCDDPVSRTQPLWLRADVEMARAEASLESLRDSEQADLATDELAQAEALAAETAILKYALDNRGSYEGATFDELLTREPVLGDSEGLTIEAASTDGYTLTIPSRDGSNFTIERDAGSISYTCDTPGGGGCSTSGTWEP